MPASKPKEWFEKFWLISIISLSLGVILISLSYWIGDGAQGVQKVASITLKEAGFASLITFFLNISVEWINRRRHTEETELLAQHVDESHRKRLSELLSQLDDKYEATSKALLKDVFQTVYQRNIHEGIFKIIDEHILKRDYMRRNYKCSMTIAPPTNNGPEDYVEVKFQVSYDAVNLTKKEIDVTLAGAIIDIAPRHEDHCKFLCLKIDDECIEGDALDALITKDESKSLRILRRTGKIKANGSARIYLEYKRVAPNDNSEVICSTVPMDSLECDVLLKDISLSVAAASLHPEDERESSAPGRPEFISWRIDHAILPGQGVVIYWHPKRAVPQTADDPPAAVQ
jgi:hypothetical protein